MISPTLARRLEGAGVSWVPVDGDRFMVPDRDLDDVLFIVSHMVVEVDDGGANALTPVGIGECRRLPVAEVVLHAWWGYEACSGWDMNLLRRRPA